MTTSGPSASSSGFAGLTLPAEPSLAQLKRATDDYQAICLTVLEVMLQRFERRPDYPFVDTKLDLSTGRDFPDDDPIRGLDAVYGWIQGRGLEALAGHGRWLRDGTGAADRSQLLPRIEAMIRAVLRTLRRIRDRNGGHLFFLMRADGTPFVVDEDGRARVTAPLTAEAPFNTSDLFASKGMLAAAGFLGDGPGKSEALEYCQQVEAALFTRDSFVTDQQPLDPKNPVLPVPGRFSHGSHMISLGTVALRARLSDASAVESGLRLLQHEMTGHVNIDGRIPWLQDFDFWEAVDADGQPYREADGSVVCDPGHALEFVGLAANMIRSLRESCSISAEASESLSAVEANMPAILTHIHALCFQPGPAGICKSYDLVSRRPTNTDMPWWSLPETMRAAAHCAGLAADDETRKSCLRVLAGCHNAFVQHYVRPDVHLMAVQTRSADGAVSPAIPATADADPGYHTGLSLIDLMEALKRIR
ncbi:MAG: hypothetical protein VX911_00830 [Candidatus Latescibacterota bacterium]|nr:hypothetical protein [Candidatus Latescibacterota bacterium]